MPYESDHSVKDDWYAALDGGINDSVVSIVIDGAGAGDEPDTPFYANIDNEQIEVTDVAADTPSAGHSTLTVVRGVGGTSAAAHADDATIEQNFYAIQLTEAHRKIAALNYTLVAMLGAITDGVVPVASGGTSLDVQAQSTPDMTVKYKSGAGLVSFNLVAQLADSNSGTFTAPTTNPRIDTIQIDTQGVTTVKTGTEAASPSAPAVDSGNLKRAEIYHRVGSTSIKDTDDSTNSYITDARVFV